LINPQETAKTEYNNFILITAKLTDQIYNQKLDLKKNLRPAIYHKHEKQNTTREEHKMPK